MYSKTRLGSDQIDGSLSLSPRGKRIVYLIVAAVVVAGAAIGIWSAVSSDSYGSSANGCVSLTVPSSTGAGSLHYCGAQAKAFCRNSFAKSDPVSLAARTQCDLAGLTEAKVGTAG
jgi:hypothetical protein